MKKDMPLEGLRWSRDSGSALYDTPQTAVLGRAGGVLTGAEAELLHPGWTKDKKGGVSDEEKQKPQKTHS